MVKDKSTFINKSKKKFKKMEKILIGATFFFRENSLLPLELEGTLNDRIYKCHLEMNRESDQDTVTEIYCTYV